MAGRIQGILDRWHLRKVQERWQAARQAVPTLAPYELRALRTEVQRQQKSVNRLLHAIDQRLTLPLLSAGLPRGPLGTDWAWRPDAWSGRLAEPGSIPKDTRNRISEDLSLYHDCPLGEIILRQLPNAQDSDRAPYGLSIELFGFQGSFLSLATKFPAAAVTGLKIRHLIRLDAVIETEHPVKTFARLNVKHGPNVAQLVQEMPLAGRNQTVDFDLAYAKIEESRIESVWLDLIFNDAAFARIILRDVVFSRSPRAEA